MCLPRFPPRFLRALLQVRVCSIVPAPELAHAHSSTDSRVEDGESTASSLYDIPSAAGSVREDVGHQLTTLQVVISEAVLRNGGAAHIDTVFAYVRTQQSAGRVQVKNSDPKRAILASLSKKLKTTPLFERVPRRPDFWRLGPYNPFVRCAPPPEATDVLLPPPAPLTAVPTDPIMPVLTDMQSTCGPPQCYLSLFFL